MGKLVFTSFLDRSKRKAFEDIFYHNVNQYKMLDAVAAVIERYGKPTVSLLDNRLWVTFASGSEAQTLFVLDQTGSEQELAGAIVYTREDDELVVLFAAVRPEYTLGGERSNHKILLRMIDEVRDIARRVKGITTVTFYARGPEPIRFAP